MLKTLRKSASHTTSVISRYFIFSGCQSKVILQILYFDNLCVQIGFALTYNLKRHCLNLSSGFCYNL